MPFLNYTPKHECELPEIKKSYPDGIIWQCDECGKKFILVRDKNWGAHRWDEIEEK